MFGGANSFITALKQAGAAAVVGLMVLAGTSGTQASAATFSFGDDGPEVLSLSLTEEGISVLITAKDENGDPELINVNGFGLGVGPAGSFPENGQIAGGESLTFDFSPREVAAIKAVVFEKSDFEETFDLFVDGELIQSYTIAASVSGGLPEYHTIALDGVVGTIFTFVGTTPDDPNGFAGIRISELVVAVPLPGALPLMAGGLALMGFMGWRRKKSVV